MSVRGVDPVVNPLALLPVQYPGTDRGRGFPEVDFAEELLMGYRWYDAQVRA